MRRVLSHVQPHCSERQSQLAVECHYADQGARMGVHNPASHSPSSNVRGRLGWLQEENSEVYAHKMEENGPADDGRKNSGNIWETLTWAIYDGEVPVMRVLRSILGWRTTSWWRNRSVWSIKKDPAHATRWKHKIGFHNRGVQWDTPMSMSAGGKGLDTAYITMHAPQFLRDDQPLEKDEAADGEKKTEGREHLEKETKRCEPLGT